MTRFLLLLVLPVIWMMGCKNTDRPSMTGEEEVDVADFIAFFPQVDLPYTVADTLLTRKSSDSSLIGYTVFTQFVPDSILKKDFGKAKPKLYALGKAQEKNRETYLFVKATQGTKRVGYLVCFDKKNNYLNALPIVRTGTNSSFAYGLLDNKFQVTTYRERKDRSGDKIYKKNVFIYNSASGEFTLILTEPNEDIIEDVINPIDTLSQKNKYTGDYEVNKKNFVSFRDGRSDSEIIFFVHFEKDKGECIGELKGTARFVSEKKAVYNISGNPCRLEFTFTSSSVTMKEEEGCGSYRGIKCFFEGKYPKKKKKQSKNNK